ncbi:MAG: hypothetical protein BWX55_00301 [Deltaproteobacteria bacterium ADurb.Bin022]|nr:MAG: hypothetical protein BWX55_00301 [Deltaproteobacteria bacterium ADurb.Bin022]
MQFASRLSDAPDQFLFDGHVDVFIGGIQPEFSLLEVFQNRLQRGDDFLRILFGDNLLFRQHRRMGNRSLNVAGIEPLIVMNGRCKFFDTPGCGFLKPSAPWLFPGRHFFSPIH